MKNFIFLSILALLVSCKQEKQPTEGQAQMKKVMAIHDEIMPKMGELASLTAELKAKVDTTETGMKYEAAMKDLQNANSAMMDWMGDFGKRFDYKEIMEGEPLSTEKQEWLKEEEQKVLKLQEQFTTGIANAKELLGKE
ncbi:hypothetical protein GCM10011414_03040 [Croceivirga lutea]|uniref:hypothetical protein n=1 Tax=Croceivirga lutea TaxID=1775167 RepID=UPI00163B4873|nr:hypothetical protein [Croceivirga lutea]GGG37071.1 hypothetical protein GCM10011414_03040 [Croceivirga lutea]